MRRTRLHHRIGIKLLPALLICVGSGLAQLPDVACESPASKTTVVVVRHADRDGELLNEKGMARAESLRELVSAENVKVSAVLHSKFERTRQTVQPILEDPRYRGNVEEITLDGHEYAEFADAIRRLHASGDEAAIVVVSGHSNTVRPILEQFNKSAVDQEAGEWFPCNGEICHSDYDDLWIVTICGSARSVVQKLNYGETTPSH